MSSLLITFVRKCFGLFSSQLDRLFVQIDYCCAMDEGINSTEDHVTRCQVQASVTLDQEGVRKESTLRLRRGRRATKDNISKKIDEINKCMSQLLSVEETSSKEHQFSKTFLSDLPLLVTTTCSETKMIFRLH